MTKNYYGFTIIETMIMILFIVIIISVGIFIKNKKPKLETGPELTNYYLKQADVEAKSMSNLANNIDLDKNYVFKKGVNDGCFIFLQGGDFGQGKEVECNYYYYVFFTSTNAQIDAYHLQSKITNLGFKLSSGGPEGINAYYPTGYTLFTSKYSNLVRPNYINLDLEYIQGKNLGYNLSKDKDFNMLIDKYLNSNNLYGFVLEDTYVMRGCNNSCVIDSNQ